MKPEFSPQIFKKNPPYIKFLETLCSGSRVVPRGWMNGQMDTLTDMPKLRATFCNFANMPKNTKQPSKTALTRKTDQHTIIKTYTTKSITSEFTSYMTISFKKFSANFLNIKIHQMSEQNVYVRMLLMLLESVPYC